MVLKMVTGHAGSPGLHGDCLGKSAGGIVACAKKGHMPIDLVITDVVMPDMSGRELRDKLLVIRPDLKVLFMSGYTSNIIAHHGVLEEGMQFIQKPFSMKRLGRKRSDKLSRKCEPP